MNYCANYRRKIILSHAVPSHTVPPTTKVNSQPVGNTDICVYLCLYLIVWWRFWRNTACRSPFHTWRTARTVKKKPTNWWWNCAATLAASMNLERHAQTQMLTNTNVYPWTYWTFMCVCPETLQWVRQCGEVYCRTCLTCSRTSTPV